MANQDFDPANEAMQQSVAASQNNTTAIQRKLQAASQTPESLIHQGLKHLDDPDNGMDYETRMAAVQPLLQAKHFGSETGQMGAGKSGISNLAGGIGTASTVYNAGKWAGTTLGLLNGAGAAGTWAGADAGASGIGSLLALA